MNGRVAWNGIIYAPEYVGGDFNVSFCEKLKSLAGAPVHADEINVRGCKKLDITLEDKAKFSNIRTY